MTQIRRLLISISLLLWACAAGCAWNKQDDEKNRPLLSLMTYNVSESADPAGTVDQLETVNADIYFLQETTPPFQDLTRMMIGDHHPHLLFHYDLRTGGMGIVSRAPLAELFYDRDPNGWYHGQAVILQTRYGPIQLLNVHFRSPPDDQGEPTAASIEATNQWHRKAIVRLMGKLSPGVPTIILGDFSENDGAGALRYLAEHGFTDILGQYDSGTQTWHWQPTVGGLQGRYGHILISGELRAETARAMSMGGSGHFPLAATIGAIPPPEAKAR